MATYTTIPKIDKKPEIVRKTKVETTYEYVPILGELLGFWRKSMTARLGDEIQIHLQHTLDAYDRLFINGKEIPIPRDDEKSGHNH